MKEDYRTIYSKYYGIEIRENFDIHHIDFDRNNNDMDNLILLPKEIHKRYHKIINIMPNLMNYQIEWKYDRTNEIGIIEEFCDVMRDIEYWKRQKNKYEFIKQNEVK